MTARPMTLETVLRHQGFTIDSAPAVAFDVTVTTGVIHVPAMVRSSLTWRRDESPTVSADMYLQSLPIFDPAYLPVILSHILDRYRTRRIGYNTPGEFMLAFRRWGNLNMTVPNLRYMSSAVVMPLDDRDNTDAVVGTVAATTHALDVDSDFPQSLVSGSTDYASGATDRRGADNTNTTDTTTRTGRGVSIMQLLAEQREVYLNVDAEVIESMEVLFLSSFDQPEADMFAPYGPPTSFGRYGWDSTGYYSTSSIGW